MNSLKRRFNAAIKEVEDLLNEKGEIKKGNVGVLLVCKENTEKQSQKYYDEFEGLEETMEENEENEQILENYESIITEASKLLNQLKESLKGINRCQRQTNKKTRENQKWKNEKPRDKQKQKNGKNKRETELEFWSQLVMFLYLNMNQDVRQIKIKFEK